MRGPRAGHSPSGHRAVGPNPAADGVWATSAITWLGEDRLLVEERDGARPTAFTELFEVDLRKATNLLGGVWDDPATTPSLEVAPTDTTGVVPGAKRLVFDAVAARLDNGKLEGAAVRPAKHGTAELFIVDDNDFGVDGYENGAVVLNNAVTRVDRFTLPAGTVSFGRWTTCACEGGAGMVGSPFFAPSPCGAGQIG